MVPANATSAGFTATVTPVASAQAVTLKASSGSTIETFALQLNASVPTLAVATSNSSTTYVAFAVTFTATISSGPIGSVTFYNGARLHRCSHYQWDDCIARNGFADCGTPHHHRKLAREQQLRRRHVQPDRQVVNKATPSITRASPSAIVYGTALSATQLNASSTVAGTFAYTPAAGTVPKTGAQTLSVTFTPTDTTDYSTATTTVPLTVSQAAPTITWASPSAIVYGTALSATQLNASSTVAGTFAYTPAAGTVPKAGAQTLSVTFTPTDTTDFTAPQQLPLSP